MLSGGAYNARHDKVAINLHWHLCGKYELPRSEFWWNHSQPSVIDTDSVKVLWDFKREINVIIIDN